MACRRSASEIALAISGGNDAERRLHAPGGLLDRYSEMAITSHFQSSRAGFAELGNAPAPLNPDIRSNTLLSCLPPHFPIFCRCVKSLLGVMKRPCSLRRNATA